MERNRQLNFLPVIGVNTTLGEFLRTRGPGNPFPTEILTSMKALYLPGAVNLNAHALYRSGRRIEVLVPTHTPLLEIPELGTFIEQPGDWISVAQYWQDYIVPAVQRSFVLRTQG